MMGESKEAKKVKAKKLVTALQKSDFNESAAAKKLGITRQAVRDRIKKNPLVRTALERYMQTLEKSGVTDEKSARVISEAMDATITKMVKVAGGDDGEREIVTEDDHYARLKANEQYLKLKRLLSDNKTDPAKPEQHLHIHMGDKATNEILAEIRSQLTTLKNRES
jgi:predicted DNA-binding protein YlxM (UPF0122 family)